MIRLSGLQERRVLRHRHMQVGERDPALDVGQGRGLGADGCVAEVDGVEVVETEADVEDRPRASVGAGERALVVHKGLRRFIEDAAAAGLQPAVLPKVRRIVSFLQDMEREEELRIVPSWKAHQLAGTGKAPGVCLSPRNWRITFQNDQAKIENHRHIPRHPLKSHPPLPRRFGKALLSGVVLEALFGKKVVNGGENAAPQRGAVMIARRL